MNQRLLLKGEDALALITATSDTGERANENPVLDFVLDVRPGNYPSFTGHCRQTVPPDKTAFYRTGGRVGVKFIPGSDKVVILGYAADENEFEKEFSSRPAPAESGSAVAPVKNRSATKYYLTIAGAVLLPILVVGFIGYVLLLSTKHSAEYACAVSTLKENSDAVELIGEPMNFGFTATGNISGSSTSRVVHFETSVSGPKGGGTFNAESFRTKDGVSTMKMSVTKAGEKTEIYNDTYPCK